MLATILALALTTQAPAPLVGPPEPWKIQAEANYLNNLEGPSEATGRPQKRPSKKARYRAYNARYEAEQAAEARALQEYQRKMAPIWAQQAQRQQEIQLRQYEIELRHRSNLDFNDAIRGVTRPR